MSWAAIAERAGAHDLFVLKPIGADRLFNVGGHGRGAGWAGNVSANPGDEPLLHDALESGVARRLSGVPFRAFGPYWTREVAAIEIGGSVVVVAGDGITAQGDGQLRDIAREAFTPAGDIPEAKRDADEAEVQQAVLSITSVPRDSLERAARGIAANAARALSCEFAAVLLTGSPVRLFVADEGWHPPATEVRRCSSSTRRWRTARRPVFRPLDSRSECRQHRFGFGSHLRRDALAQIREASG